MYKLEHASAHNPKEGAVSIGTSDMLTTMCAAKFSNVTLHWRDSHEAFHLALALIEAAYGVNDAAGLHFSFGSLAPSSHDH